MCQDGKGKTGKVEDGEDVKWCTSQKVRKRNGGRQKRMEGQCMGALELTLGVDREPSSDERNGMPSLL